LIILILSIILSFIVKEGRSKFVHTSLFALVLIVLNLPIAVLAIFAVTGYRG